MKTEDRSALIRLASSLPKGDGGRRAILAGLKNSNGLYRGYVVTEAPIALSGSGRLPVGSVIAVLSDVGTWASVRSRLPSGTTVEGEVRVADIRESCAPIFRYEGEDKEELEGRLYDLGREMGWPRILFYRKVSESGAF